MVDKVSYLNFKWFSFFSKDLFPYSLKVDFFSFLVVYLLGFKHKEHYRVSISFENNSIDFIKILIIPAFTIRFRNKLQPSLRN